MYDFWINGILLPVTPGELEVKISNKNKTVSMINEGEVNLLKLPGLTEIKFECILPQTMNYPFARYPNGPVNGNGYLDQLEALKVSKKEFQFIVYRRLESLTPLFMTNITVVLEEYTITESVDDGYDLRVEIHLKQYRPMSAKTVTIAQAPQPEAAVEPERPAISNPTPEPQQNTTYTVVKGDCLWAIARKFYGNGALYPKIQEANKAVIEAHHGGPNMIWPGDVLTIPAA